REAHEARGAFAHLADVAGRSLEIGGEDRLNRVDDQRRRRRGGGGRENRLEVGLAQQLDITCIAAQSIGAELHLERRFLARRIERPMPGRLQSPRYLQSQRRLSDSRLATD